jgi:hypothetical protein
VLGGRQTEQPNVVQAPTAYPAIHFLGLGVSPVRQVCSSKNDSNGGRSLAIHVTAPTPPIQSTDRTSHSRNSPRATRNATVLTGSRSVLA